MRLRVAHPCQDEYACRGCSAQESRDTLKSIFLSQIEVEDNDIRLCTCGQRQSLSAIGCFTNDSGPWLALEQHTQASAHDAMVVNDQDTNRLETRDRHTMSPLQRDIHQHNRTTVRRPFDMCATAKGRGTLSDRAWSEGDRCCPRNGVIRDAEVKMVVITRQDHSSLCAARVPPHITQPFCHHLKHLGSQTIVHGQGGLGFNLDGDTRRLSKFSGKALHSWQQANWQQDTFRCSRLTQLTHIMA